MEYDIILKYFPNLTDIQADRIERLLPLYRDWNSKINVISRKDIDSLYLHHVLHSLAIARIVTFEEGESILDVGTGGGFPGIPLAILFPLSHFTLCDSIAKKIKVAGGISDALGLDNVTVVCGRVENLHKSYDWIVSRAVTELRNFIPWVNHSYSKGMIFLKGGDTDTEITECSKTLKMNKEDFSTTEIQSFFPEEYFAGKKLIYLK